MSRIVIAIFCLSSLLLEVSDPSSPFIRVSPDAGFSSMTLATVDDDDAPVCNVKRDPSQFAPSEDCGHHQHNTKTVPHPHANSHSALVVAPLFYTPCDTANLPKILNPGLIEQFCPAPLRRPPISFV